MSQRLPLNALASGMYLLGVHTPQGSLRVAEPGHILDKTQHQQLRREGVTHVEVAPDRQIAGPELSLALTGALQFARAQHWYAHSAQLLDQLHQAIATDAPADIAPLLPQCQALDSLCKEAGEALCALTQIKHQPYAIGHSLNCAILLGYWGHKSGLTEQARLDAMTAGLLMDCGMAALPEKLLAQKKALSRSAATTIRAHVDVSLALLSPTQALSAGAMNIIAEHHERLDGSGYPGGLVAPAISAAARMAAIVDSYDALTSLRPYREPLTPAQALATLRQEARLDGEYVAEFARLFDDTPPGSLVQLHSGKAALIWQASEVNPNHPKVMLLPHSEEHWCPLTIIDLAVSEEHIAHKLAPQALPYALARVLPRKLSAFWHPTSQTTPAG